MDKMYSEESKAGELCKQIETCCLIYDPYRPPDCEQQACLAIILKIDEQTGVQGINGLIKGYSKVRPVPKDFNFKETTVYANFASLCGELEEEEVLKIFQDYLGEPTKFETCCPAYILTYKIKCCTKHTICDYPSGSFMHPVYKEVIDKEFIKTLEIEVRGSISEAEEPDGLDYS